ncbi:MAG: hypothetical protein IKZ25_00310, partial [Clostridia bacterium]|nr:hypothetical protein [Clostridia bacterium]
EENKMLYVSRKKENPSGALSPCSMTPDDVDYEMSKGKNRKIIEIIGMNQESFEYFVEKYGEEYEYIYFFKCQLISDFSPLEKLKNLQGIRIFWNRKTETLWDMSQNPKLQYLHVIDCKKITYNPIILGKAIYLEDLTFAGDIFSPYPMKNLDWMQGMSSLKKINLYEIKLEDRKTEVLSFMPNLKEFNFPAGMFTVEEIAYMCAKYPSISGSALCAYNTKDAILSDVRVCGYKKPGLNLPKDQARLDKYIREFDMLVEKYKEEI